jgi:RNA polymerase sigma factor (sigma-70 family)
VVPHEADLRARLRRMAVPVQKISDIVQDAYLRISKLDSVAHIQSGRAYFFTTARMALLEHIRRDKIVRIDSMTEMEALSLADEAPGPERQVSARQELARVRALITALPDRCREIFELRRIQGVPQREIAALRHFLVRRDPFFAKNSPSCRSLIRGEGGSSEKWRSASAPKPANQSRYIPRNEKLLLCRHPDSIYSTEPISTRGNRRTRSGDRWTSDHGCFNRSNA